MRVAGERLLAATLGDGLDSSIKKNTRKEGQYKFWRKGVKTAVCKCYSH